MSRQAPAYKRRNYFVKKDFQAAFILKFCLIVLIGAVISSSLLLLTSRGTLTSSFNNSRLTIENTWTAILPNVVMTGITTLVLITLAAITVTLFVSHKIGGPLFRLENEVEKIGKGDLTRQVSLRGKDQITPLAEGLSMMTASLNEKVLGIRTEVQRLIESASGHKVPQELVDNLNNLHTKIEDTFKI
jgi:methyl-accepting chemotaxis protein